MCQVNANLQKQLQRSLPETTLKNWIDRYRQEQEQQKQKSSTPATNCSSYSWKRRRITPNNHFTGQNPCDSQFCHPRDPHTLTKNIKQTIKNKAIYFGRQCELPYLHSSDTLTQALSHKQIESNTPLLNPPSNINRTLLISLKSLHIYYTPMQSLRQLGTGWGNLKQLTINHAGLHELSGLSSFSTLEYLFVAFNRIKSLAQLMFHQTIQCVDLERNQIDSMEEINHLESIDKLEYLSLSFNPIMVLKENRRLIVSKFDRVLCLGEYTRMQQYVQQQQNELNNILSYEGMQISNWLVKRLNEQFKNDQMTVEALQARKENIVGNKMEQLEFYTLQVKTTDQEFDEEVTITPLIHFVPQKQYFSAVFLRYLENKLYVPFKNKSTVEQSAGGNPPDHKFSSLNRPLLKTKNLINSSGPMNKQLNMSSEHKRKLRFSLSKKKPIFSTLQKVIISPMNFARTNPSLALKRRLLRRTDSRQFSQQPTKMIMTDGFKEDA